MGKEAIEEATFIGIQISAAMTQDPMHVFELIQVRIGECATQALPLAFAERIQSFAIEFSDMKPIRANEYAFAEHRLGRPDETLIEIRADDFDGTP